MPFADILLSDGRTIPGIAFGSGSVNKFKDIHIYIENALEQGFTSLDTAQFYDNEKSVGIAIRESGLKRTDLFVTTKWATEPNVRKSLETSLSKLGLEYVDLFLIHDPRFAGDNLESVWRQFEELHEAGLAKSIGVSNYGIKDLEVLLKLARVKPVVNQVQFHPYNWTQNKALLEFHAKHNIATEGYSSLIPITQYPGGPVDTVLAKVAQRLNATPTQVIFSWVKAKGVALITTTSKREHLKEYLAAGDLPELTAEEVAAIDDAGSAGPPSGFHLKSLGARFYWSLAAITLMLFISNAHSFRSW